MTDQETPAPDPNPPIPATAEIFRQAMARSAAIHQRSIDDMQRHTDEMHNHLRAVTHQRAQSLQIPDFDLVRRALLLDPGFWAETVARAVDVLQQCGAPPTDTEHTNESEEKPGT